MKLATYRYPSSQRFQLGIVVDQGGSTSLIPAVDGDEHEIEDVGELLRLGPEAMESVRAQARRATEGDRPVTGTPIGDLQLAPPILRPGKVLGTAGNYRLSTAGDGNGRPDGDGAGAGAATQPVVFAKFSSSILGTGAELRYPVRTERLVFEGELAVVVGRRCYAVTNEEAKTCIAGYTIVNDMTSLDLLLAPHRDAALFGKNFPTGMPCGPWFVDRVTFGDPTHRRISTWVNGELRQEGTTADMICPVEQLVSHASFLGLEPGDLIATGTPAWSPEQLEREPGCRLAEPGDTVDVAIDGIGHLITVIGG